ncbi:hypothetical protein D3C87_1475220 [compost metagenome]
MVSNVSLKDISNTQVDFSTYGDAGASITLGSSPRNANITHYYSKKLNYLETNGGSFYAFFKRNAHEVGHIPQLEAGSVGHVVGSLVEYAKNILTGEDWHDGKYSTKEPQADIGENRFINFNNFIDENYGPDKLKKLFENKSNSQKDIIDRIDQWWNAYQSDKFNNSKDGI